MKQLLLFLSICLISFTNLSAQITDYVTGVGNTVGIVQNETTLFIASVSDSKIYQVDLTQPNLVVEDFLNDVPFPSKMILIGEELYFTSLSIGGVAKVNTTASNPQYEIVVSGLNQPYGIDLKDNFIYVSLRSEGSIVKFDYTAPNPTVEPVVSGLGSFLSDITIHNDFLYMARGESNLVSRIDVTQSDLFIEDIVTANGVLEVEVQDNVLYYSSDYLTKLDLLDSNAMPETILSGVSLIWDLIIENDFILAAQQTDQKVSRIETEFIDPSDSPDLNALTVFYNNTNGDNWNNNTNWFDFTKPLSSWHGVVVSNENNRVDGLNLFNNNLSGNIPVEIGNLTELKNINFPNNLLSGSLPTTFGNLNQLKEFRINNNTIVGSIPTEIFNLSSLEIFSIGNNLMSGNLPSEIGNLINLTWLDISLNNFEGLLPSSLNALQNLTQLNIASNRFEGTIPFNTPIANVFITNNLFDFSDIEPYFSAGNFAFLQYSPQNTPDETETVESGIGATITLNVNDTNINRNANYTVMNNEYQWFKDNVEITNANGSNYTITNAQESDSGEYHCEITNSTLPDLIIVRAPITVSVDASLSLEDENQTEFSMYPNPAKNWLNINVKNFENAEINIYDIKGRLIQSRQLNNNLTALNIEGLQSGIYILKLEQNNIVNSKRFIKE
ncbi:T9SS type A sorting domain-containing protein [Winogradskyella ursingii]|uniref:T9SS type A sorting domain-containing protein n=1 Tax=Winogradskyella ursingii TaxID=2686079 RepID=UPI0015CAF811|nr:T9SS type A sorting domain-containing protein [Winogradskyella ursingii]